MTTKDTVGSQRTEHAPPLPESYDNGRPKSQAFPRENRLLTGADFRRVLSSGRRHRAETLTLISKASARPRLGIAVPKKQVKRAVRRNRIKRIIRDSFRQRAQTLPNCDLVVLCRAGAIDDAALKRDIEVLLDRLTERQHASRQQAPQGSQQQET